MTKSVLSPIIRHVTEGTELPYYAGIFSPAYMPDGGTVVEHHLIGRADTQSNMTGRLTTGIPLAGAIVGTVTSYSTFGFAVSLAGSMTAVGSITGALNTSSPIRGSMAVKATLIGALANRPPTIQPISDILFEQGVASTYNFADIISDPDGNTLLYTLSIPPSGLPAAFSFDRNTGILSYDGSDFGIGVDEQLSWTGFRVLASDGTELSGFGRGDVAMTGQLTSFASLAGGMVSEAAMTGVLTSPRDLIGALISEVTMTGELEAPIEFQGVASAVCTMSGTLSNVSPLFGDIVNNVMMSGVLYAQITEIKGSIINSIEMSGSLSSAVLFEGTMLVNVTGLGRLGPDYIFDGNMINSIEMVGKLTTVDKTSPWEQEPIVGTEWTKEAPL